MHYRYRGSTAHSVPSPRYYREILPIPTVITAVTAVLPHSPLPCHSLVHGRFVQLHNDVYNLREHASCDHVTACAASSDSRSYVARNNSSSTLGASMSTSGQLSLLPSAGWEMSSSLRATGWRPSVADYGDGMSAGCNRGSNCSLLRAMDGRIVRCGIVSSCQSAATSEIVKRFWSRV